MGRSKVICTIAAVVSLVAGWPAVAYCETHSSARTMPNHDQSELDSPKKDYYCGPVAAWNSIEWLYDTYPTFFKDTKPADWKNGVNELGGYMKTDTTQGTWVSDFVEGKRKFFEEHGKPGSWVIETKSGDWNPATGKWEYDDPTWAWIKEQFDKGQDVEVVIRWDKGGAHWTGVNPNPAKGVFDLDEWTGVFLTLTGYTWIDDGDMVFDLGDTLTWQVSDPHQDPSSSSMSMSLGTSPVAPGAWIRGTYDAKSVWITAAIAQSPVPEPGVAAALLSLATCCIAAVVWRRLGTVGHAQRAA